MKKTLFLIAAMVLAVVTSQAQTEKGTQTIGLGLQYMQNDYTSTPNPADNIAAGANYKLKTFSIGLAYSYFIADKLDIGGSFNYLSNSYTYPPNYSVSKQTSDSYGGQVYLRKYFMFGDKIGLRAGPYLNYSYAKGTSSYFAVNAPDDHSKTKTYGGGLAAELVYYPTKRLGLSAMLANLNYNHSSTNDIAQGNSTSKNLNLVLVNSGLALSVFYVFGGK